ncbi:MmgE/PrpD family protein [Neorhizobium alkalisoli]|uniref:2-methylcitrate dehydratase PrpD n=1 Tax=Neorhizobium alkalisoli TaxID=528178 RepID=A0A561R9C2_9HYPH|nr:MmgE/PrpD family protein [Neorhizobium alkalisoli]TWF59206.1 2-methylcitrate dehydratase PrpD [Neorhizobium alkalisoli]
MADVTRILSHYAAETSYQDLPAEVVVRAKLLIIDFIGSIVRASKEADSTPSILAMVRKLGLGAAGDASVFGLQQRYSPAIAALLNGAFGHSLDFDDTHASSSLHPSAPVVSAAFAAAQTTGSSGKALIAAIVTGYEVCCRLGNALDPTAHYARGFHPTATAGVFGAAAAVGNLYGLDAKRVASAYGVAASQAAGSLQFLVNGAWNKRYQVGAAAMNGVIAATLAREGFVGAADAIEGKHGFLSGYSDGAVPQRGVDKLGETYETMMIGVKPYPSCRYTHAAIDGILSLRSAQGIAPADIISIDIGLHRNGITLTGEPLEAKRRPRSVVDGQFSMPFTAAVAMKKGQFGWDDYALLGTSEIDALASRVTVSRDESLEGRPHPFGANIRLRTSSGEFSAHVPDPRGEPENFPTEADFCSKFRLLAEPVLGTGVTDRLLNSLLHLDDIKDMSGLAVELA